MNEKNDDIPHLGLASEPERKRVILPNSVIAISTYLIDFEAGRSFREAQSCATRSSEETIVFCIAIRKSEFQTKNADSRHGRVVDLPAKLAAVLQDFVGTRRSCSVFCEKDGSQISRRDILKYSLHPILKKLELEQGGLNIFRRFRITAMETAEVPQALPAHLVGICQNARVGPL